MSSCAWLHSKRIAGKCTPVKVTVNSEDINKHLYNIVVEHEMDNTYKFRENGKFIIKNVKDKYSVKGKWRCRKWKRQRFLILNQRIALKSEIEIPKLTPKYLWMKHSFGGGKHVIIRLER